MKTKFAFYRAKDGWRWRARRSGKIVADSGESYQRKPTMLKSLNAFIASIEAGRFEVDAQR